MIKHAPASFMKRQELRVIHVVRGILTDPKRPDRVLIKHGDSSQWEIPGCVQPPNDLDPIKFLKICLQQELSAQIEFRPPKLFRRLTDTKKPPHAPPQLWFVDFYTAQLESALRVTNAQKMPRVRWVTKSLLAQMDSRKFREAHYKLLMEFLTCK
jgi:hypothetical protein